MINKEQPKQGTAVLSRTSKEEESVQWLSWNERKIKLPSQKYVQQKYYSQLNIKLRCFQTWMLKAFMTNTSKTRIVKKCALRQKKNDAKWKSNSKEKGWRTLAWQLRL